MTEAYLGPVKLDANGEASGEGWRVRHDGRGSLCLDIGTCYFGASPEDLENTINIYVSPGNRCENASLVEWARQVGWPGYETEHLTCGPLRLERLRDPSNRRMDCWQWESCQFFVRIWTSGDGFFCKTGKTSSEIMLPYAAGRSPTEAAQALAAAIEASTDPAVVRFRAEHWVRGEYEVTLLEPPTKPSLDLNAHAKEWAKYWDRGAAFAHWSGKLTKAQHDEWLELVVADDSVPTALCALVAELMARWDYPPGEALRRARYLVARTLEPLALLVDTPEEQVARCRASVEGETLGVEAAGTATPSPPSPVGFFCAPIQPNSAAACAHVAFSLARV